MARPRKPRQIPIQLIPENDAGILGKPHTLLRRLVEAHHHRLALAKIGLAWHLKWRADPDGHVRLGKAVKVSDLHRRFHGYDFLVLLNRHFWQDEAFTDAWRQALLDHELCHCGVRRDKQGDELRDEEGRPVWRVVKHDVEEFQAIADRYGLWKSDLERFAKAALGKKHPSLFDEAGPQAAAPPPAARPLSVTLTRETARKVGANIQERLFEDEDQGGAPGGVLTAESAEKGRGKERGLC
jgi:hypothetical protein